MQFLEDHVRQSLWSQSSDEMPVITNSSKDALAKTRDVRADGDHSDWRIGVVMDVKLEVHRVTASRNLVRYHLPSGVARACASRLKIVEALTLDILDVLGTVQNMCVETLQSSDYACNSVK